MSHRTVDVFYASLLLFISLKKVESFQLDGNRGLRREIQTHDAESRVSYGNFAVDKFHRLQVSVGSSRFVSDFKECALSCVNNPPCSSFNVASSARSDGKLRCELLNKDKYSASPGQLVSSQEYHHYEIKVRKEEHWYNPFVYQTRWCTRWELCKIEVFTSITILLKWFLDLSLEIMDGSKNI